MGNNRGNQRLLGALLVEHGAVRTDDIELALTSQIATGKRIGETLVDLGLVSRPALARALAGQSGIELEEERGYGMGLRAKLENWHRSCHGLEARPEPTPDPEDADRTPRPPQLRYAKAYMEDAPA